MDPIGNPYAPGAGSMPPALVGREAEVESFEVLLKRLQAGRHEKSMLVTGLRGVGKTVLLNEFSERARALQWFSVFAEVRRSGHLPDLIARLTRRALITMSRRGRLKKLALEAMGVLRSFSISAGGVQVTIDVDPVSGVADSGDLEEDLGDLLAEIGKVAVEARSGVVFLLDEIQLLTREELEALMAGLHRVSQEKLPVTLVGVGLPLVPKLTGEAKSYAERLFDFRALSRLSKKESSDALTIPAEKAGVTYQPVSLNRIFAYSQGYPYFVQEYGKHVWNCADDLKVTLRDVETAHTEVLAELDKGFFHVRLERTPQSEQDYMAAMADLGTGPWRSSDVAKRLGFPSTSGASLLRDNLIKKGLIYSPRYGLVDFTVPMFDDYLRRTHPFDRVRTLRRRRPAGGGLREEVFESIRLQLGEIVDITVEDETESYSYPAVRLLPSGGSQEEILAALEVIDDCDDTWLSQDKWEGYASRWSDRILEPFLVVISDRPIRFGADAHLRPRVSVRAISSPYPSIDEIIVYMIDLSGEIGHEEKTAIYGDMAADIVKRSEAKVAD
jgi:hypothetical protein